jgi:catechol 2,3-dioxygenase-like lactoylglutathione lyase family enzyme
MFELSDPVADIAIICCNFDESLRFYHELLGMEIAIDIQIPGELARQVGLAPSGFRQVRLRAGDTLIKLAEMPSPPPPPDREFTAGVRWLTFKVRDVASTVERLKQRGVEFLSEPVAAPDAAGVVCARDPDGILIEFVQPR